MLKAELQQVKTEPAEETEARTIQPTAQEQLQHIRLCCCFSCSVVSDSLRPMNCSPPGSSAHGILQARILEWVAFPCPENLPDPRVEPGFSALQADSLPSEPPVARLCRWSVFPYVATRGREAQGSAPARGKGVKDGGPHSPGTPVP